MSGKEASPPYRETLIANVRGSIGGAGDCLTKTLDALAANPLDQAAVGYAQDHLAQAIGHLADSMQTLVAFDGIPYPSDDADLVIIPEEPIDGGDTPSDIFPVEGEQ